MLHTTLLATSNPWPEAIVACIALCAIFGWPRFGPASKGIGGKELRELTKVQTAMAADLVSIKSDLGDLKQAIGELDRVLKSVE